MLSFTEREYQTKLQLDIRKLLVKHKRIIAYLPTGGGKTVVARRLIEAAVKKGLKVAFLCDRIELITQAYRQFSSEGLSIQIIDSFAKNIYKCDVYIGMVESFFRRLIKGVIPPLDLLLIDECHTGSFFKVIQSEWTKVNNPRIVGFTATPISSQANLPLNKLFDNIIIGATVEELVSLGYLMPAIEVGHDELLEFQMDKGDFSIKSQFETFRSHGINQQMFQRWKRHASDRKTICFNVNKEHNRDICELFNNNGISALTVDSDDNYDDRVRKIELYRDDLVQVLCNVGIATKGFDDPQTDCTVANFSTTSLSKWIQCIGRSGRPFPGKKDHIIIDMGNNVLRHGGYCNPNAPIDWEYIFRNEDRARNFSVKKTYKLCPKCYTYYQIKFLDTCEMCGNDFRVNPMVTPESQLPETLRKPTSEMSYTELHQYAKATGKKSGWAFYQNQLNRKNKGQTNFFNRFSK